MLRSSQEIRYDAANLAELLSQRAEQFPERTAFVFENEDGQSIEWTYGELDSQARVIANRLAATCRMGDRALLVYPPGLDLIGAFFGCIYAGILPVPATHPKPRRPLPRLDAIVADCAPSLVLTHSSVLAGLQLDQQDPSLSAIPWLATDVIEATETDIPPTQPRPEDIAFLQYTSGSTSTPRGVMVSHANVLSNLEAIRTGFEIPSETKTGRPELISCMRLSVLCIDLAY